MYAVIAGAGEVGENLAKALYKEGYNLAIIEKDPVAADEAEGLDALIVRGNAASPKKLAEAGIDTADVFLAVTGSDEVNLVSCAVAKTKGCKTIARINSLDYIDEPITDKLQPLGVDVAVCPELVAAIRMSRILTMPSLMDVEMFAGGKIQVVEARVKKGAKVAGKALKDVPLPKRCNVAAIFREGDIIIPHGNDILYPTDRVVLILADTKSMPSIEILFSGRPKGGRAPTKGIEKIMIIGATRIGIRLAKQMERRAEVILLDNDEDACRAASEQLSGTLVINGSGTDEVILTEEGIAEVDAFVATTHHEDTNILSSLLGKEYGAGKTIAIINKPELKSMLEHIGIDVALSPRLATVGSILQHTYRSEMLALSVFHDGEARVVEMKVAGKSKAVGKPLRKLRFPRGSLIGAIVRGENVIIPSGDDSIRVGDRLIIFARANVISKVEQMFTKTGLFF